MTDFNEAFGIRECEECGKGIREGFTDMDGGLICCKECFNSYMDKTHGKNAWRETEDDGCEGYYQYYESEKWYGTGIFWTEWE